MIWDVTFGLQLWERFFLKFFFSYTFPQTHKGNTHILADNLKRRHLPCLDAWWSRKGQSKAETRREWRARPRHITLTSSSQTRGRDRRGSLTWKRGWRAAGSLECVKRKLQAPVCQAAQRQREEENETDKSWENSKTPAVSSSSSSSLSLLL